MEDDFMGNTVYDENSTCDLCTFTGHGRLIMRYSWHRGSLKG